MLRRLALKRLAGQANTPPDRLRKSGGCVPNGSSDIAVWRRAPASGNGYRVGKSALQAEGSPSCPCVVPPSLRPSEPPSASSAARFASPDGRAAGRRHPEGAHGTQRRSIPPAPDDVVFSRRATETAKPPRHRPLGLAGGRPAFWMCPVLPARPSMRLACRRWSMRP